MHSPFDILEAYERRSLAHAVRMPEREFDENIWRGVGFRVGDRHLVSDFREVVEIVRMPPITPVPGAQPWLLGVGNLRGNLFPVVDLKQFMEGQRTSLLEGQRVLIMRQSGGDVALTIDELFGQRSFAESQAVQPGELAQGRYAHFIDRAFRGDTHDWGVFSLSLLSRTPEFRQAAA
ncbi:chemotaxis protein CheW [Xanthomonas translucens]|uniref:chemotaxis protein CheW n=2 Tax=Xanthomonas campestris pv. translucens TaxID=343 RepID=UPI00071E8E4E|nr:chemotaxis protein CheW [Xanthomonas translucens]KWV12518.1 chemotaxis protein CheW [Xanthomonas translucens]MCS3361611.1 chemotaxis protein CheW [Xanthomonas translucens pv. translucens]MCS3375233.1 chemotaxis protein CheW [Xanthomonas translucens pv. translucens]MCT8276213.1 chemotaxis protein CheW [Xanthomonas translucens pv. translucens]MCT8279979.1 chemotaxis protein CheW [Xanthomonas translucens pv. translucens]